MKSDNGLTLSFCSSFLVIFAGRNVETQMLADILQYWIVEPTFRASSGVRHPSMCTCNSAFGIFLTNVSIEISSAMVVMVSGSSGCLLHIDAVMVQETSSRP